MGNASRKFGVLCLIVKVREDKECILFQDGMTAIHLAAKQGHTQILDVLKAHVSLKVTSTKVIVFSFYQRRRYSSTLYKFKLNIIETLGKKLLILDGRYIETDSSSFLY